MGGENNAFKVTPAPCATGFIVPNASRYFKHELLIFVMEMQCSFLLGPLNSNGNEFSAAVADNSHMNGFIPSLLMSFICFFRFLHTFSMEQTLLLLRKVALTFSLACKEAVCILLLLLVPDLSWWE